MIFQRGFRMVTSINIKKYSTTLKPKIEVNEQVVNDIENEIIKPRKHPGIFKPKTINIPEELIVAIKRALEDYPVKQLLSQSKTLVNYLNARHPPIEDADYKQKKAEVESTIFARHINKEPLNAEEAIELKSKLKRKIDRQIKSNLYHWKPMEYKIYTSLQYLLGRSAQEYSVLVRIFHELSSRDPKFKPRSLFDFGSGVGTGTWAAKLYWQKYLFEYFNVDASADMNDLALILLKGGTGLREPNIKGVFHRQFLPASNNTYDLVLSAYTLLELPSSQSRLETILKLWNKTERYLVIVEFGTNAGFKVINEARDFILDIKDEANTGFVFSPCSHDNVCPRFLTDSTPCNFNISYMTIPIGQNSELHEEKYCYVVLKKGKLNDKQERWPRIVRPTLVRSKHVICRMCTANGKLEEVIFSASKQGKIAYRCAKVSKWGDLLPVRITEHEE